MFSPDRKIQKHGTTLKQTVECLLAVSQQPYGQKLPGLFWEVDGEGTLGWSDHAHFTVVSHDPHLFFSRALVNERQDTVLFDRPLN